jgi:2-polyprenyl-6-methoxyphenol hydroxylase-like FAD-dependent oxidoreductase
MQRTPHESFKGQGANQALLDALALARTISSECRLYRNGEQLELRKSVKKNLKLK